MFDVSGQFCGLRSQEGWLSQDIPLRINSCGYEIIESEEYCKERLLGRADYLLLYLHKGQIELKIQGKQEIIQEGTVFLYKPKEMQYYKYSPHSEGYWIHFTGKSVESILSKYAINQRIYNIGQRNELCSILRSTIIELQLRKHNFEQIVNNYFRSILLLIERYHVEGRADNYTTKIDLLIVALYENCKEPWTITKMAKVCSLSESTFQHQFKSRFKLSPIQYLTKIRIEKAKLMLCNTKESISAIALKVGFQDPLYFSRTFKKHEGISPKQFIKINNH